MEIFTTVASTYLLVFAAEFGDKSQLVCLILAARYGSRAVVTGAVLAFAVLTALAVVVGGTLGVLIPETPLKFAVAALFAIFGIQMLLSPVDTEDKTSAPSWSHHVVFKTFVLISLSEMGDKTQLLAVGLSTVEPAIQVFAGTVLALVTTSALGAWAGSRVLNSNNLIWVHRIGALLFLVFAIAAAYQGVASL